MDFEHFFFQSGQHQLYAALHKPVGEVRGGMVLCAPFAEEQKTTYRTYAQLAAALARAGWFALHFDYRGTGDSSGDFSQFSPSAALEDIHSAIDTLRERTGINTVGLFGLRLGASFALQIAESDADVPALVMWQPVKNGEEFFKLNIKRQMVRQMLIRSAGDEKEVAAAPAADRPANEAVIDLDGYPLSKGACNELRMIALPSERPEIDGPALLVQVSPTDRHDPEMQLLANAYQLGENFRVYRCEPFWNRIGIIDTSPLIELTVQWLGGQDFV